MASGASTRNADRGEGCVCLNCGLNRSNCTRHDMSQPFGTDGFPSCRFTAGDGGLIQQRNADPWSNRSAAVKAAPVRALNSVDSCAAAARPGRVPLPAAGLNAPALSHHRPTHLPRARIHRFRRSPTRLYARLLGGGGSGRPFVPLCRGREGIRVRKRPPRLPHPRGTLRVGAKSDSDAVPAVQPSARRRILFGDQEQSRHGQGRQRRSVGVRLSQHQAGLVGNLSAVVNRPPHHVGNDNDVGDPIPVHPASIPTRQPSAKEFSATQRPRRPPARPPHRSILVPRGALIDPP